MEIKENEKKKGKKSISIFTVIVWLALIAVMTVITIGGMKNDSAAYEAISPNITIKLKMEGLTNEEKEAWYKSYNFMISGGGSTNFYNYSSTEGEYYIYTLSSEEKVFLNSDLESIQVARRFGNFDIREDYYQYIKLEINGKEYSYLQNDSSIHINVDEISFSSEGDLEIYVTDKYVAKNEQGITKSSKWIDKEQGIAKIKLQYLPVVSQTMYKGVAVYTLPANKNILYIDELSEEFELSSEYVTNDEWSILESITDPDSIIPTELENELFDENNIYTGKKYIYVKPTNTMYWYIDKNQYNTALTTDVFEFNVVYKGITDESVGEKILATNNFAHCRIGSKNGIFSANVTRLILLDPINTILISSPELEYIKEREAIIKINKEVIGEKGNKTYYVGLFTDDISDKTDKITKIDAVNGKGVATIEIAAYDLSNQYYVYEVDENGNKISDEKLNYSRNNVIFEKANSLSIREITSNKEIVSEYISTDMTGVDLGRGTGEENYIDNVLSIRDVYEDSITISSEKIKYNVTYKAEDGGTIEGETEEKVYPGYYPENVPTPKPNEGYEFIRWEVEVNGERVEVIPSEHEINKDTVFYAIFEKIPVEESVDTSDINIGGYVVVLVVAIVGIASVVFFTLKNKSKENK